MSDDMESTMSTSRWVEDAIEAPANEETIALSTTSNSIRFRSGGAGATTKNVRTGSVQYDDEGKVSRASRHPIKLIQKAGWYGVPFGDLAKIAACYLILCKSSLIACTLEHKQ